MHAQTYTHKLHTIKSLYMHVYAQKGTQWMQVTNWAGEAHLLKKTVD